MVLVGQRGEPSLFPGFGSSSRSNESIDLQARGGVLHYHKGCRAAFTRERERALWSVGCYCTVSPTPQGASVAKTRSTSSEQRRETSGAAKSGSGEAYAFVCILHRSKVAKRMGYTCPLDGKHVVPDKHDLKKRSNAQWRLSKLQIVESDEVGQRVWDASRALEDGLCADIEQVSDIRARNYAKHQNCLPLYEKCAAAAAAKAAKAGTDIAGDLDDRDAMEEDPDEIEIPNPLRATACHVRDQLRNGYVVTCSLEGDAHSFFERQGGDAYGLPSHFMRDLTRQLDEMQIAYNSTRVGHQFLLSTDDAVHSLLKMAAEKNVPCSQIDFGGTADADADYRNDDDGGAPFNWARAASELNALLRNQWDPTTRQTGRQRKCGR